MNREADRKLCVNQQSPAFYVCSRPSQQTFREELTSPIADYWCFIFVDVTDDDILSVIQSYSAYSEFLTQGQ